MNRIICIPIFHTAFHASWGLEVKNHVLLESSLLVILSVLYLYTYEYECANRFSPWFLDIPRGILFEDLQ